MLTLRKNSPRKPNSRPWRGKYITIYERPKNDKNEASRPIPQDTQDRPSTAIKIQRLFQNPLCLFKIPVFLYRNIIKNKNKEIDKTKKIVKIRFGILFKLLKSKILIKNKEIFSFIENKDIEKMDNEVKIFWKIKYIINTKIFK